MNLFLFYQNLLSLADIISRLDNICQDVVYLLSLKLNQ